MTKRFTDKSGFQFESAGRLSFYDRYGNLSEGKPAANVLIAFGDRNRTALLKSGLAGAFVDKASVLPGIRIN